MSKNDVTTVNDPLLKKIFIMDKNSKTQENEDDENVYGMRKITYLEKYGVKHFPYRGRRKYTPLIHKSVDEGIFISNDVFGLTIRQFERMYKDCLHRRKTHEQWILNLRYPDKSSNEYLEYLQNCTDCNTDNLTWPENELKEKVLFELLVTTIGTEIDSVHVINTKVKGELLKF
ncbi:unnamed protein product [Mytilus edulis]|uniref:Uncharacterized protein n=1 Tax=Mytilus edulis TaxID=6550 RepID=A0A8S3Q767_MYTED|nr:unnamed protein product [Mytilus edulis]